MENRKININRTKISAKEIKNRQDFNYLVTAIKNPPNPFWKSIGFWGVTGLASLAVFFVTKLFLNNLNENDAYENKTTLTVNESSNQLPEDTECITPHFESIDVPFEIFEVTAGEASTLTLKDGSVIHIPATALVAEHGSKITIKTRVFKDKSSAFIAGIPMDFEDAAFESAGMIEIRGFQNGESVAVNPESPLEVALSLYKDPSAFNFYALNDQTGEWATYPSEFQNGADVITNTVDSSIEPLDAKTELDVIKAEVKEVELAIKNIELPTKEAFNLPLDKKRHFKIDYLKSEFPELEAMGDVSFEALPNQPNFHEVLEYVWSDFNLTPLTTKVFEVAFSNAERGLTLKVRPVLEGAELAKAVEKYDAAKETKKREEEALKAERLRLEAQQKAKQAEIDAKIKQLQEADQKSRAAAEAMLLDDEKQNTAARAFYKTKTNLNANIAAFRSNRFGVFNCDRPIAYPSPHRNRVDFVAFNKTSSQIKLTYVFNLKNDLRYTYGTPNNQLDEFGLNKGENIVVVIYDDGDLAYGTTSSNQLSSDKNRVLLELIEQDELDEDKIKEILREDRISA